MMSTWHPPEGVTGRISTIAVSAAAPRAQNYKCPMAEALKARPSLRLGSSPRRYEKLERFTLGPFMATLDLIEQERRSEANALAELRRRRGLHGGLKEWTTETVRNYLRAFPPDEPSLRLVPRRWMFERTVAQVQYRITAWGRCYESPDRQVREIRLISLRSASTRTDAEVAIAAYVIAHGGSASGRPGRVRVLDYCAEDGLASVLFDGTPDDAASAYDKSGRAALTQVAGGTEYRPGDACVNCGFAASCPALPRARGLLGVQEQGRARRLWSVTSGRSYRVCPARAHLRELRLPTDVQIERSRPTQRGRALHSLLADQHRSLLPCAPDIGADWTGQGFDLPDDDVELGRRLLRHHAEVCPFQHPLGDGQARIEPRLTWDDADADVVVIADPDLLYTDHGSWVWREVKTSGSDRRHGTNLFTEYPQLALAVVVLARGELGGARGRSRVELEILRPGGVDLQVIDPFTPAVYSSARKVLESMVRPWRQDDDFSPRPGEQCRECEVGRWCTARLRPDARPREFDNGTELPGS